MITWIHGTNCRQMCSQSIYIKIMRKHGKVICSRFKKKVITFTDLSQKDQTQKRLLLLIEIRKVAEKIIVEGDRDGEECWQLSLGSTPSRDNKQHI